MISPNTPAGTRVVCINADDPFAYVKPGKLKGRIHFVEAIEFLECRKIYTVDAINPSTILASGFVLGLVEIREQANWCNDLIGFALERFRPVLDLPKCLTDMRVDLLIVEDGIERALARLARKRHGHKIKEDEYR